MERASFRSYREAGDDTGRPRPKPSDQDGGSTERGGSLLGEMDPLSITTGVFSLLAACVKTGIILKNFYDSVAIADTKVKGLLTEVESFTQVLHLMKDTLEQENIQTSSQATGHIDDRLKFLATSIQNGQETLLQLQETIEKVNKSVSVLDSARKHLRLRSAADEIAMHQQKIRSYRDIFQLIMQAVILWVFRPLLHRFPVSNTVQLESIYFSKAYRQNFAESG